MLFKLAPEIGFKLIKIFTLFNWMKIFKSIYSLPSPHHSITDNSFILIRVFFALRLPFASFKQPEQLILHLLAVLRTRWMAKIETVNIDWRWEKHMTEQSVRLSSFVIEILDERKLMMAFNIHCAVLINSRVLFRWWFFHVLASAKVDSQVGQVGKRASKCGWWRFSFALARMKECTLSHASIRGLSWSIKSVRSPLCHQRSFSGGAEANSHILGMQLNLAVHKAFRRWKRLQGTKYQSAKLNVFSTKIVWLFSVKT